MFFVQKIYVFFFILHKHHSEEMCWICLNVRIQKWSNCYEVELWRKLKHFLPEFLPFHKNPIQCVICQYLLSTCFHTDQWESDVKKIFLSKWFMNVQYVDRVKPHLCSSSQNIKNTFNGFVLQRICLKLSPKSTSIT
jgi:hypothetical protein